MLHLLRTFRGLCLAFGVLAASAVHAECGGQQQCIAVSIDAAVAPAHGTPETSAPLVFGVQNMGGESVSRAVYVGAVTGPGGSRATLDAITLVGANPSDFRIAAQTCVVGEPSLLADGPTCTIDVVFKPGALGSRTAELKVRTASITRTVPLSGTGSVPLPTASPAAMSVRAGTPTTLELADRIGPADQKLSVSIATAPRQGSVTLDGTRVTYVPKGDFVGSDAFAYTVTGVGGTSAPATVTVEVVPRANPAVDPTVRGLVRAQAQAIRRFSGAQVTNVQARLDALRRKPTEGPDAAAGTASPKVESSAATGSSTTAAAAGLAGLAQSAASGSVRLGAAQPAGTQAAEGFWVAGQALFGRRAAGESADDLRFRTDGLSLGLDHRVSDRVLVGVAGGYARDRSEVGSNGSAASAEGTSLALYAAYQPWEDVFVDAVVGRNRASFDLLRAVGDGSVAALGRRDAQQWFGSLLAGHQWRYGRALLSSYGRVDIGRARFEAYTETGAGLEALYFHAHDLPSRRAALGLRAESRHAADFGWVLPRVRLEWRRDLNRAGTVSMAYADLPNTVYSADTVEDRRASWLMGVGSDFVLRDGLRLGVDLQALRAGDKAQDHAVRLSLSQEMNPAPWRPASDVGEVLFDDPLRVEAMVGSDDNLNRAGDGAQRRPDRLMSLVVTKGTEVRLARNFRLLAALFGSADRFQTFSGLDRLSAGAQARVEFRASSEFFSPLIGLQARVSRDEHSADARSGRQSTLSLSYKQPLTDRIEFSANLGETRRQAQISAFEARQRSAAVQFDYALSNAITLYLSGERRRGDLVSSVPQSAAYASFATASAADDAYPTPGLTAYRYDANTTLWALGYNLSLGPRDAIDLMVRRASSTPTAPPSPLYGAPPSYASLQLSLAYLMRF